MFLPAALLTLLPKPELLPLNSSTLDQCIHNKQTNLTVPQLEFLKKERLHFPATMPLLPRQTILGKTDKEFIADDDRIEYQLTSNVNNVTFRSIIHQRTKPKLIFLATSQAWWGGTETEQQRLALFNHCPINHCKVAVAYEFKENFTISACDAVITPALSLLPAIRNGDKLFRPENLRYQHWIYFGLESPHYSWNKLSNLKDFVGMINWTATYRTDSDLVVPYSKWVRYRQHDYPFSSNEDIKSRRNVWRNKSDNNRVYVLALISNCQAQGRLEVVRDLRMAGIHVDLFGRCGNTNETTSRKHSSELLQVARKKYHFFLALENSRCRSYVTEKFFVNALMAGMIPVVRGGECKQYYKLFVCYWLRCRNRF